VVESGVDGVAEESAVSLWQQDSHRAAASWIWTIIVVLYFTWEAVGYHGLFAIIAEWQFVYLGQDFPTFTFCALTFIFTWPVLRLLRRRYREGDAREEAGSVAVPSTDRVDARRSLDIQAAVDNARDHVHFLYGFAIALFLGMLLALAWTLLLPRSEGEPRPVSIARENPGEGPARLVGTVNYGRLASFSRGILFLRRTSIYAPVVSGVGHDEPIRYFIEFLPTERAYISNGASVTHRRGILVRGDLPGGLRRLYHYLGYRAAPHYYVLYASPLTMRWPYYLAAIQFGFGALVFLVVALIQRRHAARLDRKAHAISVRRAEALSAST
jgi:hypothetical protein